MVTGRYAAGFSSWANSSWSSASTSLERRCASFFRRDVALLAPCSGRRAATPLRRGSAPPRRAGAASRRGRCAAAAARRRGRSASRRSSDSARCAPRLPGTSAWISSMITVSTVVSRSRAFDVSRRNSDSGVVMRMSAGLPQEACALVGRRVAGADGDGRRGDGDALRLRDVRDAGQRRAQVALDVDGQRLERRDVEHAAACLWRRRRLEHQAVEAPEERGQRLAAAGRGEDQRRLAARDGRPAELLWFRGRVERAREPLADSRVKQVERLRACHPSILTIGQTTASV